MENGNIQVAFQTLDVTFPPNNELSQTVTAKSNPFYGPVNAAAAALSNWSLQFIGSDHNVQSIQIGVSDNVEIDDRTVSIQVTAGLQDDDHDKNWQGSAQITITAVVGIS